MNLATRIKTAFGIIAKGSIAPFNRLIDTGSGIGGGEKLARPYAQSVWVMSALRAAVLPITGVPLTFGVEGQDGPKAIQSPDLQEYWSEPALGPSGEMCLREVIYESLGWLKLSGEFFWVFDDLALNVPFPEVRGTMPKFIIARPDRMKHIAPDGKLMGWEYTDASRRRHALLPEQVIHMKLWNPYGDFRGLGEYEAARVAAESDYYSGVFKRNLAASNGDQGVYVVNKTGVLDDKQRAQMVAQLREKREMQQRGIFKPIFLTGDISIEDPKVRMVDESFNNARLQDRHEIYAAFGVPLSMADVQASYSIGSASDYYRLIRDTCMPCGVHFCEAVEMAIEKLTGQDLEAWFDWDNHPVMKEVRREQATTAVQYWDRGISWETLNGMLDLGMKPFDGWDVSYLPFSVQPATDAGLSQDVQDGDVPDMGQMDPTEDGMVTEAIQALRERAGAGGGKEEALWKGHMAARRASVKLYESKINKVLLDARREVLGKINSAGKRSGGGSLVTKASALELTFDIGAFGHQLEQQLAKAAQHTLQKAGAELFKEVGLDDPFKMADPKVNGFLSTRQNKIKNASKEIHDAITGTLQDGIDGGDTLDELSDRVRSEFNGISKGRARTIAQTETGTAYEFARNEAMKDAGVDKKRWLSARDERVRASHAQANGQTVGITGEFEVGGAKLDHPCDPTGPAGEVINCRCVSIAILDEEEN